MDWGTIINNTLAGLLTPTTIAFALAALVILERLQSRRVNRPTHFAIGRCGVVGLDHLLGISPRLDGTLSVVLAG